MEFATIERVLSLKSQLKCHSNSICICFVRWYSIQANRFLNKWLTLIGSKLPNVALYILLVVQPLYAGLVELNILHRVEISGIFRPVICSCSLFCGFSKEFSWRINSTHYAELERIVCVFMQSNYCLGIFSDLCIPCFRRINCCKDSKGLCVEIQKYLHVFCGDHGVLQFLYSILLTKVSECSLFSVFNIMEYDVF